MASIRKRGDKWQAQVRKTGASPVSKSFHNRRDAEVWSRKQETSIDLGEPQHAVAPGYTLGNLLSRYLAEITPPKKGRDAEGRRLQRLMRDDIAQTEMQALDAAALCLFRDRRAKNGMRACQYDLVLIRHAIEIGRKEWGLNIKINPVSEIRVPNGIRSRHRRLEEGELEKLGAAALTGRNPLTWLAVQFAVATAMRRSEILGLEWSEVSLEDCIAFLPDTKNGTPRSVPLNQAALEVIAQLPRVDKLLFPVTECALRQAWERLVSRAGLKDLHFHDLRHEAISSFFEMGLSLPEVALISGHRDPRMLFRYTHLRASDVVKKLAKLREH